MFSELSSLDVPWSALLTLMLSQLAHYGSLWHDSGTSSAFEDMAKPCLLLHHHDHDVDHPARDMHSRRVRWYHPNIRVCVDYDSTIRP